MIKVGDVATIRSGFPFRTKVEPDPAGNALVLQMKDVDPRRAADIGGAIHAVVKNPETHQLTPGDLVFKSRGNTFCAVIDALPDLPLVAAIPLFVLRPDCSRIIPQFLRWVLNHPRTQEALAAAAVGTYVPTVRKQTLENLPIGLPSLHRQELIVRAAALADRERELLETIATLKADATDRLLLQLSRSPVPRARQGTTQ